MEPERKVAARCAACGDPIYEGEAVRKDDGYWIHDDAQCLKAWMIDDQNWSIKELCDGVGMTMEVA